VFFIFSEIYLEKTLFIDLLRKERKKIMVIIKKWFRVSFGVL